MATQWLAFEEMNKVRLTLGMSSGGLHVAPDLCLTMTAWDKDKLVGVAAPLASTSVRVSSLNVRTMEAALSYALYQIDFLLAAKELGGEPPAA